MGTVSYRQLYIKRRGKLYGPYWYSQWRDGCRVRTKYHGKERPAELDQAQAQAQARDLFTPVDRTRECWLLLGYPPDNPPAKRETVRKHVCNLLDAATRPAGVKAEIQSAWDHLSRAVWPEARARGKKGQVQP